MVQKKVPSKLGIQADHVTCDKHLANLKLSSSQHQDGKSKGSERKKKMKKSRPINLSDLEALQSPPPRRSISQPGNAPPLHVPITAASIQKQKPLVRTTDGSPNYMKPTSSSDAKKELFAVSLWNNQSGKNIPQKCSSSSKASSISCKKPAKSLTRSSSLNLVRTLTKTPSFKPSRTSPTKSTAAVLYVDMNPPVRATCSSTLKDSRFPAYLMLNPGGTESEGASVMNVCPYKYCSLNGHCHAPLSPLKSFVSAKRRFLKTQKSMKLETLSPRRLKMPCETNGTDIEQNVLDGKHAHNEADTGNPIITPLAQEIRMDFFVEIYAKEKDGADDMGKFNSARDHEDQDDIKSATDEKGIAAEEDGVKQVTPTATYALPECEIDVGEDLKNYFDAAAIEANTKGSFHQEQNAEDVDESHTPSCFHKGSYSSKVSYDGEHTENIELDGSYSQDTEMECEEEEQFCSLDHEEYFDSSVFAEEETDSDFESLSESSHHVSVMWLDDILGSHHADILVEEALQEANGEENTCFEAQPHSTNCVLEGMSESMELETQETDCLSTGISFDQSPPTEEVFQHLTNAEDNDRGNEEHVDDGASCTTKVLDEETVENSQGHKMSETCEIDESHEESNRSLENNDGGISPENQIHSSDVREESNIVVQDQELLEEDQGKASKFQSTSCIGGADQNTSKSWQRRTRRKRSVQDNEEMRKINPRKPNFLPVVPDPEPEKVKLKHQMIDERKDAEEWMLDFALRQAVSQLAPARKRKVALLVEAYETVMSTIPKCESHVRNNSPFAHARPILACS